MRLDELEAVCQEAAHGLLAREGRPLPPAVVLPLTSATRVLTVPEFPSDDDTRATALRAFAADEMEPVNAPCYGFIGEAEQADGAALLVVVYGARGNRPRITAALLDGDAAGPWAPAEELHPEALPFLRPLQDAADRADPERPAGGTGLPGWPAN